MKEKFIDLSLDEEIALKCVNLFKSELKTQLKESSTNTKDLTDLRIYQKWVTLI